MCLYQELGQHWELTLFWNKLGWSLGGFLSLTIARMLADKPFSKVSVAGMLIIDSPYHFARSKIAQPLADAVISDIPELIQKSFDNCDIMLEHWDLPSWDGPTLGGKKVTVKSGIKKFELELGKILHKPLKEQWKVIDHELHDESSKDKDQMEEEGEKREEKPSKPKAPPPGVMIRCVQEVAKAEGAGGQPSLIDLYRHETMLGWEKNYPDYLKAMIDFDANHYDVFDKFDQEKVCEILLFL